MAVKFTPEDVAAWTGGEWTGCPSTIIGVGHDTRRLRAGALYVALRGDRHDGHAFVAEAFQRGAAAAMVARDWVAPNDVGPLLRVADTRRALRDLARGHRGRLPGTCIGVTGSMGKTTVKELIALLLSTTGAVARNPGNWNNDIGLPLALLDMGPEHRFGVFEIAMNHPGELAVLCDILRPDWAVMTRIGPVHIEFFPSEEAIAEEKTTLLRWVPADGLAVLAVDEPWYDLLRARTRARAVTVGFNTDADYIGAVDGTDPLNLRVRERSGLTAIYRLPQDGMPMRVNALRAIALAREAGVPPEGIAEALRRYRPAPMRWEEFMRGGIHWINDAYNANPVSMRAALERFAERREFERRWLVLGGMRELGDHTAAAHETLGREVTKGPWAGVVTVGALGERIAEAARAADWPAERLAACATAEAAAAWLRERLRPGDAVLLKGSRAERVEDVLNYFSEDENATPADAAPPPRGT